MKKLSIILVLVIASTVVFGQKRMTQTAISYLRNGKLDKALEAINIAIDNEKTINDAKTWFYRGSIYVEIFNSDKEEYKNLATDPLLEAYQSYEKAMEYDEDGEFLKDIIQNMRFIAYQFYNKAANAYNAEDFAIAAKNFLTSYQVYKAIKMTDTTSLLNYAISSQLTGNNDVALSTYNELMEMGYEDPSIYESLANIYSEKKDYVKAEEILMKGRELYPDNYPMLLSEINLYMVTNQNDKAIGRLISATEKDPENVTIWFALGGLYDKLASDSTLSDDEKAVYFEKTEDTYAKAIEVQADYFDAYFNLGALYVNKAAQIQMQANSLPLESVEEYNKLTEEADALLEKALPYLEKAIEINPTDKATIVSLKEIYSRMGQLDKAKEMNEKLQ
jgi:tetratricopeptide (TPR) repeat protein